jgi:HD-GYP domain-containing protein (c-di-GMP phosphodiesterase class II)
MKNCWHHPAFRISLLYLIISIFWILFSDQLLGLLVSDSHQIVLLSTIKGWLFVFVTASLLFGMLMREFSVRQQHEREVEAIARLTQATRFAMSQDELLPLLLDEILHFTSAETASVLFINESVNELQVILAKGLFSEYSGEHISLQSITGNAIATGRPYLNNQFLSETGVYLPEKLAGLHAVAVAPLVVQNHKLGALVMAKKGIFDKTQFHLFLSLADIAASAIYRLSLYNQTLQRVQQLSTLRSIDLAITSSLDLNSILRILVEEVQKLKGISATCVLMPDKQSGFLHYRAGKGFSTNLIEQAVLPADAFRIDPEFPSRFTLTISDLKSATSSPRNEIGLAEDFSVYHAYPLVSKDQIKGVLEVFQQVSDPLSQEELDFLESLATQAAIAVDVATLIEDLQSSNLELMAAYDSTIEGWSRALDLRDKETEGHTQRVTEMAMHLARLMGIPDKELIHVYRGALLHDIGKMGIPDSILLKPAPLTLEEAELMKMHPIYAYHLLKPIRFLHPALDIPYCHHEHWDGSGYPRGLKGIEIPLAARVFAVVDVWDALVSDRPYSPRWPKEDAIKQIKENTGSYFDPDVVDVFFNMLE